MTKTKIALAAVLLAATGSAALAQGHHDRNSSSNARLQQHRNERVHSAPVLEQRDVSLPTGSSAGPFWYTWSGPTTGGL